MNWEKTKIVVEDGRHFDALLPIIVSASRSTDIPAFYAKWFFKRLLEGYSEWINPFNGVKSYVSYKNTRFIVFWSKNPKPLLEYLHLLEERKIATYIQYSLNDYEKEGLEKGIPPLEVRIETFKKLVDRLGFGKVIWRFDPLILTENIGVEELLYKIENIGDKLRGYTEKLVFSFADIITYRKVKLNLERNGIRYKEWDEPMMDVLASKLSKLNEKWNLKISTCSEKINLEKYDITHNKCIDDELIIRFAYTDKILMDFLNVEIIDKPKPNLFGELSSIPNGAVLLDNGKFAIRTKNNKDNGQRQSCKCIMSKDIGQYNTCPHQCEYCYANTSKETAFNNYKVHKQKPNAESITGQ